MNVKKLLVFTGVLTALVTLTIGVAQGVGPEGAGSLSHGQGHSTTASMPHMANRCATSHGDSAIGCPMMAPGATMNVRDIPGGVRIELTGTDSAMIASIRAKAHRMAVTHNGASSANRERVQTREPLRSTPAASTAAYTCPMHPEIVSTQAGRCPKCGMNLAPRASGRQEPAGGGHSHSGGHAH